MRRSRKQRCPPCLVRVGAMARPRDVQPGLVPIQVADPAGGPPIEADFPAATVEAAAAMAKAQGVSLEQYLERVILAGIRRDVEGHTSE